MAHPATPAPMEQFAPTHNTGSGSGSRSHTWFAPPIESADYSPLLNMYHYHELPRVVKRPYRQDNDEPAEPTTFVRETRRSICHDGRDRSQCSKCGRGVLMLPRPPANNDDTKRRRSTMTPQRVFRDLVMSDAAEPLRPEVRDALLDAFARSTELKTIKPAATARTKAAEGPAFPLFMRLPFELRRMVWVAALPARVLLRDDLCSMAYHGVYRTMRPINHVHTVEELWQSDLFHVCREARHVVMTHARGMATASMAMAKAPGSKTTTLAEFKVGQPVGMLALNITTRTKLESGLDVLYYPWLGTKGALDVRGKLSRRTTPIMTMTEHIAALRPWPISGDAMHGRTASSKAAVKNHIAPPSSVAPYPPKDIPYGHWATQLWLLAVPARTVALDVAWIDKQHPDTLAWAMGVDLSEPVDSQDPDAMPRPKLVPPECLRVVLADIVIPVFIDLAQCASDSQRQLLQTHIYAHPGTPALARVNGAVASHDRHVNLNGKDYAVLVDLYDDTRIDELFTLAQTASRPGRCTRDGDVVNKAALHRCIGCTRRAWEARSGTWRRTFGNLVGGRLEAICRPTILVSIVLAFDTGV